jgi:hypothetical protein
MRIPTAAVPLIVAVAALSGCAAGAADTAPVPDVSAAVDRPADELTARTFVLDPGDGAQLCLGGVGESLPPVCGGPPTIGWDWGQVEGEESQSGSTWGDYEVVGTWDGTSFSLTRTPVAYDPRAASTPIPDPIPDPTPGAPADPAAVARAMQDYSDRMGTPGGPLQLGEYQGRASVGVVHDDGSEQAAADAEYGTDVVEVYSLLRPVDGE